MPKNLPKIGDAIYVESAMFISRGSDDRVGGLATVIEVKNGMVTVEEFPNVSFGWAHLETQQKKLKAKFGTNRAFPDPDIDTPWIQDGDIVDGKVYHGKDIW